MSPRYLALACSVLAAPWAAPAQTPEGVTALYIDAMREGNWTDMASLMDAGALADLRGFLQPLVRSEEAEEFRRQLLGVESVDEALALSDTRLFARFLEAVISQDAMLAEALRSADVQVIGHVPEGADTAHVVYRMTMQVEGITMSQMDVFSLVRRGETWRGLLAGDLSALAAAIRQALDPPADPR